MNTTAWAEIHLDALQDNALTARALAPGSKLMAMIKGDGYGHGLVPVARALEDIADGLAVARLDEAIILRDSGIETPVLLLGTLISDRHWSLITQYGLTVVIHDLPGARQLLDAPLDVPLDVWLKLNSGMNRLGLPPADFSRAHQQLANSDKVRSITHMTHFSSAEDLENPVTDQQIGTLMACSRHLGDYPVSMANSAGIIAHPDSHGQWIRPGIMLYGDNPLRKSSDLTLRQVMQFKSRVIALHELKRGDSVGYNATWTASRDSRLAVLGAGYADGYPRHAPNGTPVLIHGERAPLAGRVSMDMMTVDITDLKASVALGDEALLWGEGLPAMEIADQAGTISYELFTGVTARVPRVYPKAPL